jgi:hypothetical protein
VLVVACGLSILYARTAGAKKADQSDLDRATLQQLEQVIATGSASPAAWAAYGRRLYEARDFPRAALAFERVINGEPYHRPARFQLALSHAAANNAEGLLTFLQAQVFVEPKLVAELLDRSELQAFLGDARFATLQKEPRAPEMY